MQQFTHSARIAIRSDYDIISAREKGRSLARTLNFESYEAAMIVTAISELARNILRFAGAGEILLRATVEPERTGLVVVARDQGPGILDVDAALQDGYSTAGSDGMGLPGVRRLMDEFVVDSEPGQGTTVTAKKWRQYPGRACRVPDNEPAGSMR